jgi:hypothetical protein
MLTGNSAAFDLTKLAHFSGFSSISLSGSADTLVLTSANFTVTELTGGGATMKFGIGSNIWTDGGADTINLAAPGARDNIFVAGNGFAPNTLADSITDGNDTAQAGFWGASSGPATAISTPGAGGLFANQASGGTSAGMSVVSDFEMVNGRATADTVNFSIGAWGSGGTNAATGTDHGLVTAGGGAVATGSNAVAEFANPGAIFNGNDSLIVLQQGTFANAGAVASALSNGSYNLVLANALAQNDNEHILVGYNDTAGSLRIADMDLTNYAVAAGTANIQQMTVDVSDMVQLMGVTAASLAATTSSVHFIA